MFWIHNMTPGIVLLGKKAELQHWIETFHFQCVPHTHSSYQLHQPCCQIIHSTPWRINKLEIDQPLKGEKKEEATHIQNRGDGVSLKNAQCSVGGEKTILAKTAVLRSTEMTLGKAGSPGWSAAQSDHVPASSQWGQQQQKNKKQTYKMISQYLLYET